MISSQGVSFILPCLNEAISLPEILAAIHQVGQSEFRGNYEVIVVDNGSHDQSAQIATECGARVVECAERGYGAAVKTGLQSASCDVLVFTDADGTYNMQEVSRLVAAVNEGFDLVIGSRFLGAIEKGAMPILHQYVGTPLLTACINILHAPRGVHLTDCNSGFRCIRREAFHQLGLQSKGMEFASEMLVSSLRKGLHIREVPIHFKRAMDPLRKSHLRTWRDGIRHLAQIAWHAYK